MFDRGDSRLECLIEETAALNATVSSIKHSRLLSPLSNIQGCCLLYQTFKAVVSSIKHSGLLSPLKHSRLLSTLSNIQGNSLECLIE
jgi:hypothetical protein